jgi:4-amino-4-deoxy-L-arabinose transferase-like glycosyltransferase
MRVSVALGLFAMLVLAYLIALQPPPFTSYTIGAPGEGHLPYGFWSAQTNTEGSYRWSDGDSWLRFFGYGTASDLDVTLRVIGPQGSRDQETTLRLRVGDMPLLEVLSPDGWRNYHLLVPATGQGWQTPEIWIGGTVTDGAPNDGRSVGVALSAVQVRPLGGLRPLAIAEYAAFAALLMVLIWVGLAQVVRPALALGVGLTAGVLLLLWFRQDPLDAAYFLPPLWGMLLLPAGVLAAIWLIRWLAPQFRVRSRWLGAGLGLGLAGSLLLRAQIWPLLGGALLLGGTMIATAALTGGESAQRAGDASATERSRSQWYGLAVAGCVLIALALRLVHLDTIPFGLWRDEARHGLIALQILADPAYRPIYVPTADIPALLFYLQTISITLIGPTAGAVRVVPAVAGSLTILGVAFLARTLWGRTAGLAAALMLALSAWHIALSRLAFAAVLDPLLSLIALALLWRMSDGTSGGRGRLAQGALAGLALGLALYTYHPARLMPLAALLWVALRLGRNWVAWRRALPALAVFVLVAGIVTSPLLTYWISASRDFNQRVGQVSLLDRTDEKRSLSADLNRNVALYALMWNVAGDQNPRHNIPGTPMLDPISGLLFLIGLLLLLADQQPTRSYPLLALLAVGLLPGLLSGDAPHSVRSVDVIAPSLLIAAYAVARMAPILAKQPALARVGLPTVAVALIAAINIWSYFGRVPYDPRVWHAFAYTEDTAIGRTIQRGVCHGQVFVPKELVSREVIGYLAYGHSVAPFNINALPAHFPAGSCVFVPSSFTAEARAQVAQRISNPTSPQVFQYYPGTDQPVFWMYQ